MKPISRFHDVKASATTEGITKRCEALGILWIGQMGPDNGEGPGIKRV